MHVHIALDEPRYCFLTPAGCAAGQETAARTPPAATRARLLARQLLPLWFKGGQRCRQRWQMAATHRP